MSWQARGCKPRVPDELRLTPRGQFYRALCSIGVSYWRGTDKASVDADPASRCLPTPLAHPVIATPRMLVLSHHHEGVRCLWQPPVNFLPSLVDSVAITVARRL